MRGGYLFSRLKTEGIGVCYLSDYRMSVNLAGILYQANNGPISFQYWANIGFQYRSNLSFTKLIQYRSDV